MDLSASLVLVGAALLLYIMIIAPSRSLAPTQPGLYALDLGPTNFYRIECSIRRGNMSLAPLESPLLFPWPKDYELGSGVASTLSLADSLMVSIDPRLSRGPLIRFCEQARSYNGGVSHLVIHLNSSSTAANSSYELIISRDGGKIEAQVSTKLDVHPLLSTLTQLLSQRPVKAHLPLRLHDWPNSQWRGLLVDTARHFIPLKLLRRTLDAMEVSKFNVLHLHLTDTQSFPLLLRDVQLPEGPLLELSMLAMKGAFDNRTKVYTADDLKQLVAYASDRGITIVPEIDMPAHSYSWGKAFRDLVVPYDRSHSAVKQLDMVPLDVSNPLLLPVVSAILDQVAEIFPSKFIHVGGDEVRTEPWNDTPHIKAWMKEQGHNTTSQAFQAFETSVFSMLEKLGRVPLVWQGVLDSRAMPNSSANDAAAIVQPWKCWGGLAIRAAETALLTRHPVVMSSCWYLDYETDWLTYIASDQGADALHSLTSAMATRDRGVRVGGSASNFSPAAAKQGLLGGEASMWTERVDLTNFECRVWPRASAVASRLWGWGQPDASAKGSVTSALQALKSLKAAAREHHTGGAGHWRRRAGEHWNVEISASESSRLHGGFVHLREFLVRALNVSSAPLIFHVLAKGGAATTNSSSGTAKRLLANSASGLQKPMRPLTATSEDEALDLLASLTLPRTLGSDQSMQPPVEQGTVRMTAQCLAIPEVVQRPVVQRRVVGVQLNAADGSAARIKPLLHWLTSKATAGVVFVGFCELNGWDKLQSDNDLMTNVPLMSFRAAAAGFTHSHILTSSAHPYHIGLMSALPFEVVAEYGPPLLQRGALHAFIPRLSLHVIVTHLHAHDSRLRTAEARFIADMVLRPLIAKGARVVLQGDLNTISPLDAAQHEHMQLVQQLGRKDYAGFMRLSKKFLDERNTSALDYRPMEVLLATGMVDACAVGCKPPGSSRTQNVQWQDDWTDEFSRCMTTRCQLTVPTEFSNEWTNEPTKKHPAIRVDYALVSPAVVRKGHAQVEASVERTDLSDHYPIEVSWQEVEQYDLARKRP